MREARRVTTQALCYVAVVAHRISPIATARTRVIGFVDAGMLPGDAESNGSDWCRPACDHPEAERPAEMRGADEGIRCRRPNS